MIVAIGEVLIDLFEDYDRIGGAPFNFAFHLKQLGYPVRFITRVGDDRYGRRIIDLAESYGFNTVDIQIDPVHPTGTVKVCVDDQGVPMFDIHRDVAYDYLQLEFQDIKAFSSASMIYVGTLAQRTAHGFNQISRFIQNRAKQTNVFLDVNLRPPHINDRALAVSLALADIVKLNTDELDAVRSQFNGPADRDEMLHWLLKRYQLSWLILTRGASGSTVLSSDQAVVIPTPPVEKLVDTVGAGDAYASVMAAGYLQAAPVRYTAELAADFASRICAIAGAIPETLDMYSTIKEKIEGAAHGKNDSVPSTL